MDMTTYHSSHRRRRDNFDPLKADNPNLLFIHDRAGISIDPVAVKVSRAARQSA
jgi:hypothetical protein